jgi:hypothetical protein
MTQKYKTVITAKAELVDRSDDDYKAIANKYGLDLHPQMDLLYVRSCLVSAGTKAGINANDDTFTREEAWAARFSPVLKPANWQHNDKDILGVVYSVEARDLDGNPLDLDCDTPPECEFELWTEAVIYKLLQPERANEIETRALAGDLFVSMEAWFDDYSYGICDNAGKLDKIVARNKDTSHLDNHLKANRGSGQYRDQRLVRVLSNITFGGYGFVDQPANERSVISDVRSSISDAASTRGNEDIIVRIRELLEIAHQSEELVMNAKASDTRPLDGEGVEAAVEKVLDRKAQAEAKAAEDQALKDRATAAEEAQASAEDKVKQAEDALKAKEAELAALESQIEEFNGAVDEAVKSEAGATGDTPPEIAAIDAATDGASAFAAKLAWLTRSRATLVARAARADELEEQLAEAAKQVRASEVRQLFAEIDLSDEEVEAFVTHAADMEDDEYAAWRDQQEIIVLATQKVEATDPKLREEKEKMEKKDKGKEAKASDDDNVNLFAALLETRRADAEDLVNHPGKEDLKSGVSTSAPGLKTPRHKIAGSAGDDAAAALENAQADDGGVNLAGAADGGDSGEVDDENGFRTLAAEVTSGRRQPTRAKAKVDFDPVE